MPIAEVGGVRLWYEVTGSGPFVLQVPGAVSAHEGYAAVTPRMAKSLTVINAASREYAMVAGAGHANLVDSPESSSRKVIEFLKGNSP